MDRPSLSASFRSGQYVEYIILDENVSIFGCKHFYRSVFDRELLSNTYDRFRPLDSYSCEFIGTARKLLFSSLGRGRFSSIILNNPNFFCVVSY